MVVAWAWGPQRKTPRWGGPSSPCIIGTMPMPQESRGHNAPAISPTRSDALRDSCGPASFCIRPFFSATVDSAGEVVYTILRFIVEGTRFGQITG